MLCNVKMTVLLVLVSSLSLLTAGPVTAQTAADQPKENTPATLTGADNQIDKQPSAPLAGDSTVENKETVDTSYLPYIGEITGNNTNIRSGPAAIYYEVTQFNKGMLVVVREEKTGWAWIEPAGDCFSWISKQFVKLIAPAPQNEALETDQTSRIALPEPNSPANQLETAAPAQKQPLPSDQPPLEQMVGKVPLWGEITADNVRVRAGSVRVPPANASEVQTRLNKGAQVLIIDQKDDFYKIAPPPDAFFWVSLDFIKRLGPVTPEALAKVKAQTGSSAKLPLIRKDEEYPQYRALAQLLKQEVSLPLDQQDFTDIRRQLQKLLQDAQSITVRTAAQALERQLVQCELGLQIWKTAQHQNERLNETLDQIDSRLELLIAFHEPPEKTTEDIVVTGRLANSAVFTTPNKNQRFLVLDDSERIICYAVADKVGLDLSKWIEKGPAVMVGKVEYDPFGKVRVLKVANIVEPSPEKKPTSKLPFNDFGA